MEATKQNMKNHGRITSIVRIVKIYINSSIHINLYANIVSINIKGNIGTAFPSTLS